MIERNRRTQLFKDKGSARGHAPTLLPQHKSAAADAVYRPKVSKPLSALCIMMALTGGAWLATGCAQTKREPAALEAQQQQQQRPRRAQDNANTTAPPSSPPSANGREKTDSMNSEANAEERKAEAAPSSFYIALEKALAERGATVENVCDRQDSVSRRILEDYGAIFVASKQVKPPPVCMFESEADVTKFQREATFTTEVIAGSRIELQPAAMKALQEARAEAGEQGLSITPRGGSEAARRSYDGTLRLWNSRFLPALAYWKGRGRLSDEQVARLRRASLREQVREVLELEKRGIFFSKDLSKSILYSVAAPGTSQHLSMLAFDVSQFGNARVRRILARHGWFQTVKSDLPHFTYLGVEEKDLPALGLRRVETGGQVFWIPNI
ncbi:MAG TPA: hypothetical protein VF735_22750 [Pyrinomonadaceae bacterium]|jgi:hypothetical protein